MQVITSLSMALLCCQRRVHGIQMTGGQQPILRPVVSLFGLYSFCAGCWHLTVLSLILRLLAFMYSTFWCLQLHCESSILNVIRLAEISKFKFPYLSNGDTHTRSERSQEVSNSTVPIIGVAHDKCLVNDKSYYYGAVSLWARTALGALCLLVLLIFSF